MVALLTRETLQVVDVGPRPHDHLERRDDLVARRAVAGGAKQPGSNEEHTIRVMYEGALSVISTINVRFSDL